MNRYGLLEDGITLTQPDPRPPFWEYMSQSERQIWDERPIMRQQLIKKYNTLMPEIERDMLMRRSEPPGGLLGEGNIPLPDNWGNLVNPDPDKSLWYQLPADQSLLEYGTRSGDGLRAGGYSGSHDYPEHAPNTPEAKQAYNFLRFNNKGGGI